MWLKLNGYKTYKYPTVLSDTLLVHISGFVHPTRTKIPPFDSAFQALYIAPTFVKVHMQAFEILHICDV